MDLHFNRVGRDIGVDVARMNVPNPMMRISEAHRRVMNLDPDDPMILVR